MQTGKLRHRVTIETATESLDSYGHPDPTWTSAVVVWASIEPLAGNELLRAQEVNAEISIRIRIRYHASVTPRARLKFGSRYFEILSVANLEERGREMELLCREAV